MTNPAPRWRIGSPPPVIRWRRARSSPTTSRRSAHQVRAWIADPGIDVIITTGGTGFTGRDVTPEAIEPLFEKRMDGFSIAFHMLSHAKIGTSTIQSRATAGVAGATYIFCLPGSPGACRDGWDGILAQQLDYRTGRAISSRSCRGWTSICGGRRRRARRFRSRLSEARSKLHSQVSPVRPWPKLRCGSVATSTKPGLLIDLAGGDQNALGPQRDLAVAAGPRERDAFSRPAVVPSPCPRPAGSTSSSRSLATCVAVSDQKDRADRGAVDVGDPAAFARGVERRQEFRRDLRRPSPRTRSSNRIRAA